MQTLTPEDRTRINNAVADAERNTTAEIVPVLAQSSGRYDRAEDAFGACCGIFVWLLVEVVFRPWDAPHAQWAESSLWPTVTKLICLIAGTMLGMILSSHVLWLRRFFIPRMEMLAEVNSRAREIFFDQRVHHTAGRTGVLLYVSDFERRAVVLADETVVDLVGQSQIEKWCDVLTNRLRSGDSIAALEQTIIDLGHDLERVLPGSVINPNELPDALVTTTDL